MISYLEVYAEEIAPRLKTIDLWLKSGEEMNLNEASLLLELPEDEISALRTGNSGYITRAEFLSLMAHGSSEVCGLYRRELERKSPATYTVSDVSYIYGIDRRLVQAAFDKLGAVEVTEYMLSWVFSEIWV